MIRVGEGFDVHRLVEDRPLILGGVRIPHTRGLLGHSDADALVHAVCNACLGAAALGDIGRHFPDSDERYRDADSRSLLRTVRTLLDTNGWRVVNVDATIVAQLPKLAPYAQRMAAHIADDLGIAPGQVNVKAATTEGLGFTGREEGMAVRAVVLIEQD
ncbi:MAG: 2-C-methyl-D-erythritol 2,4-cyclodiphosphate synthase [Acidiferrobacteraceae bacterium]